MRILVIKVLPLRRIDVIATLLFMKTLLSLLFISLSFLVVAQKKATVSGYITDARSGEALGIARIFVQELKTGTVVNNYGFYSLTLPIGIYQIEYRCDGFVTIEKTLTYKPIKPSASNLKWPFKRSKISAYRASAPTT